MSTAGDMMQFIALMVGLVKIPVSFKWLIEATNRIFVELILLMNRNEDTKII